MSEHAPHGGSHMHDFEAHVRAVEEDLEYYRAKRIEPRVFTLLRRGIIAFGDLFDAAGVERESRHAGDGQPQDVEQRIRALEDRLDDYVREIGLITSAIGDAADVVTEDGRVERGDYDEFFRFAHREYTGPLEERVELLTADVKRNLRVVEVLARSLMSKGVINEDELNRSRAALKSAGPWNGGRIVARAWVDPGFKKRLVNEGRPALRDLGIPPGRLGKLGVLENTDKVHNVIVCTLCSCYPYDLLGDTPWWYKQDIYKKRIVANPRAILEEMFELKLPSGMEVRVHDSTSDVRYMVIPRRPKGSEGMNEAELAKLVTIDSLIGAGEATAPADLGAQKETPWGHAKPRPRDY
ncbi:MAG TPA: nitrile hydratase subunit alpha [Verrucomicrobiae bacterium]|nr:nitrile hydratase subunit alpha [Verrucomicrobiae bacterium]